MKIEKENPSVDCFCSRGIFSLFESKEHSNELVKLRRHAIFCLSCREKMVETERIYRFFNQKIPLVRPSKVLRESYENEINDMMKDLIKSQRENNNHRDKIFSRIIRFLFSRKIWFYGCVLMMFLWMAGLGV